MSSFEEILEKAIQDRPSMNREKLVLAGEYAVACYAGRMRVTGSPYIKHALEVVEILLEYHPDESSIIAALLHGAPDDPDYSSAEIVKMFGEDVESLVTALGTLGKMKTVNKNTDIDNLRRMFLAMAKDVRVIMIKLADRLHLMRNLDAFAMTRQKSIARETMDIYVPISSRLGIYNLKVQIEDLCFKYLYPRPYDLLNAQLEEYKQKRVKDINEIKKELQVYLSEHGIQAVIEGRIKNLYSIYRKLKMQSHTTLDDIYDVFATRVILPTKRNETNEEQTDHLYAVLGLIHNKWKPIANRFKDYIAVPKPNGYQSLHTSVLGLSPLSHQSTEIQIRSQRMHDEAEYGLASHWLYEDMKKILHSRKLEGGDEGAEATDVSKYLGWLDVLSRMHKDIDNGSEFMEALKLDVFNDRIFILTPNGEVKDLPQGATPVDFAYAVHTDVGHSCMLAKVNTAVVPLDYKLNNGEVVEIICGNKPAPKLSWLSFVKSSSARAKIKAYFRSLDKERNFKEGKEIINKFLLRTGKPLLDDGLSLFRQYGGKKLTFKDRQALVEEIGNGSVLVAPVLRKVFGKGWQYEGDDSAAKGVALILSKGKAEQTANKGDVFIAGEKNVPYKFAQCCRPVNGDAIVAYVTRGNAVSIHTRNCKVLKQGEQRRIIEASWGQERPSNRFPVRVSFRAKDRIGLIRDITQVIADHEVNILDFGKERYSDQNITREIVLEVADNFQLSNVLSNLQRVKDMLKVEKVD